MTATLGEGKSISKYHQLKPNWRYQLSHTYGVSGFSAASLSSSRQLPQPRCTAAAKPWRMQLRALLEGRALTSRPGFYHDKVNKGKKVRNTGPCSYRRLSETEGRMLSQLITLFTSSSRATAK